EPTRLRDLHPRRPQRIPSRPPPAPLRLPELHRHERNPSLRDTSQTAPSCIHHPDKAADSSPAPAPPPAPHTTHPEEQCVPPERQCPPPYKPLCSFHKQNGSAEYGIPPPSPPPC